MKKIAAILLLLLLVFNLFGYRLWFYYMQQQSDAKFVVSLDKEIYNPQDLITIKVPLALPYQSNWDDFERVDGEVTVDGKIYKYVKRKVQDGQLVLLCLPNHTKMRLETAREDFFKLANSLQSATPVKKPISSQSISFQNIISEYVHQLQDWRLQAYIFSNQFNRPCNEPLIHTLFTCLPEQPPEVVC